jgi:hypothetical protein
MAVIRCTADVTRRVVLCAGLFVFGAPSLAAAPAAAVEYFHGEFNHYFVTANPAEAASLDAAGVPGGWARTGQVFAVDVEGGTELAPVCRFFSAAFAPKSSHFFTADPAECALVKTNSAWLYEADAFYVNLPAAGSCPAGTAQLYRLYNDGPRFACPRNSSGCWWFPTGPARRGSVPTCRRRQSGSDAWCAAGEVVPKEWPFSRRIPAAAHPGLLGLEPCAAGKPHTRGARSSLPMRL